MSKTLQKSAQSFFNTAVLPKAEGTFIESFEAVSPVQLPTISIPISSDLTEKEKIAIQKILVDDFMPGRVLESDVTLHVEELTNITRQIKCINAQSVLLHGERIKKAQGILSQYKDGAFTKWLMSTYGNRQTPYCMLNYFEFYQNAPKDVRPMIEAAPKKAVYLLASREGDETKKLNLIKEHSTATQSDLLILIQDTFPVREADKRKPLVASTIDSISKLCAKLEKRSKHVTDDDRMDINKLIQRLQKL